MEYVIIDTKEWKKLGTVEANNPLDALKEGIVKFNNPHVVAVYKDFDNGD